MNDRSWFLHWQQEFNRSDACLIIFTDKYLEKLKTPGGLRMEAYLIRKRLKEDKKFRIFALNTRVNQGPNDLRIYLNEQKHGIGKEMWLDEINALDPPLDENDKYEHRPQDVELLSQINVEQREARATKDEMPAESKAEVPLDQHAVGRLQTV